MVDDPTAKAVIALIQSQGDIGRLTAGPPGIPQDRLDALRAAYKAAMEDKELLAKAEKLQVPIDPLYGERCAQPGEARAQPDAGNHRAAEGRGGKERGAGSRQQGHDRGMGWPRQARAEAGGWQDVPRASFRLAHRGYHCRTEGQPRRHQGRHGLRGRRTERRRSQGDHLQLNPARPAP